jgi:hypothetical protein
MPVSQRVKKEEREKGGHTYWETSDLRMWNNKIEVSILKKDKELSNSEAVDMAIDLVNEVNKNVQW